jgi:hypothetical protein
MALMKAATMLLFIATTAERAQATTNFLQAETTIPAFHSHCAGAFNVIRGHRTLRHFNTHFSSAFRVGQPHDAFFMLDARRDNDIEDTLQVRKEKLEAIRRKTSTTTAPQRTTTTTPGADRFVFPVAAFVHNNNNNDDDDETSRAPTIIRLGIEPGPLIGGPSWLPVHVKVVLRRQQQAAATDREQGNNGEMTAVAATATASFATPRTSTSSSSSSSLPSFAWDFVPIRARDEETLKEIMQLRSVPGKIRFFSSGRRVDNPEQLLLSKLASSAPAVPVSKNAPAPSNNDLQSENLLQPLYQWAKHAQTFCDGYTDRDLHVIFNNCWTFAFQLCVHLLLLDKQQQQQQ